MEQWRDIPFEGWHECEVSDEGRVRKKNTGRIYKPYVHTGYFMMTKTYGDRRTGTARFYRRFAHVLVAAAFPEICGEWFEGAEVDHINGDTLDNRAENLRVCTHADNMLNENTRKKRRKPVLLNRGFKIYVFPSVEAVESYLHVSHGSVRYAIHHGYRTGKKRKKKNRDRRGLDTSYRAYWLEDLVS